MSQFPFDSAPPGVMSDPLFWQALGFTGAAVAFIVISAWWLYLSQVKAPTVAAARPSPRLAGWFAGLLTFSAAQLVIGALWDASMHLKTGEIPAGADFLWPPHIMIYSSFLVAFVVALAALGIIVWPQWQAGVRDPRQWVRRNPYLGAVALASVYMLMAIPGDALWHELYGIDLTAWSPPHVLIGITNATVLICGLGLLRQARPAMQRPAWSDALILTMLALMLNVAYLIGALEWELPGFRSPLVEARPLWAYPLVGGGLAFATLILAKRLTAFHWAATIAAVIFYTIRLGVTVGLGLTGNIMPLMPVWFILGAVLLDAVVWDKIHSLLARNLGMAAAFTLGYTALALPLLGLRSDLPALGWANTLLAVLTIFMANLALSPLVNATSARLISEKR